MRCVTLKKLKTKTSIVTVCYFVSPFVTNGTKIGNNYKIKEKYYYGERSCVPCD